MYLKISCILAAITPLLIANVAQAANPEHVARLLKTKECNNCDLSGADLIGAVLTGAKLQGANLNAANLSGADLSGADLTRTSLAGSSLVGANLQKASLNEASLVYANLALARLNNALLTKTDLQAANLMGSNLLGAKITKSSFVGANLYNLKANSSIYDADNGNVFKGTLKIDLAGAAAVAAVDPATANQPGGIFDESGVPPTRVFRKYRIPLWIGKPLRSTAGAIRFYNQELQIGIW